MNPYRYLPRSATVTLLLFIGIFGVFAMAFAWKGFAYMLGTILFGVGVYPSIKRLSEEGHTIDFAWGWRGKRYERSFNVQLQEKNALRVFNILAFGMVLAIVPIIGWVLQVQGTTFAERLQEQQPAIRASANAVLAWAQSTAPAVVPDGDLSNVFGGVLGQIFGDMKNLTVTIAGTGLKVTSVLLKDWILIGISALLIGVLLKYYETESTRFRSIVAGGISDPRFRRRTLRFLELYQRGLNLLMVGFLEVALTLTVIYFLAMSLFPFNLSLGAILLIALTLGFITAVWKVGGAFAMVIGALLIVLNFEGGLSWFGLFEFSTGNLFTDILIKVAGILAISKVLGLLEAYNYTPTVIGKKLNLTKMQMVATILIWALGAGFFGMIWGVLLMLLFQASQSLTNELREQGEEDSFPDPRKTLEVWEEDIDRFGLEGALARAQNRRDGTATPEQPELALGSAA